MKRKLSLITIVGLAACTLAAFAQTTPPAADTPATPAAVSNTPAAPAAPPAEKAAPAPAAVVAANDAAQPAAKEAAPPAANAPAEVAPGGLIPLIVMDDVPLTDAIRNLARQAKLNYVLDPKVAFGQPGADGKVIPQPTVSLRWENVTAEQALAALLNNYSLQLVADQKSKIARISPKDPAAPDPLVTKIIQLKYAAPTNVMASIQSVLLDKRSKVVADVRTSQLVVNATEKELTAVDQLVERLDTITKQVLIEAKLMETTVNPSSVKGIDWSGTLKGQNFSFGNNVNGGQGGRYSKTIKGATDPVIPGGVVTTTYGANNLITSPGLLVDTAKGFNPATAFLDADGVSAVLSFLNSYAETKVLSTPRSVTLDNETATIEVGTMFPIVQTTAGTANTTGGSSVAYSNLTVRLDVTPRISANNYVNLKVSPRILRLGDKFQSIVGDSKNDVYSFSKRELQTSVLIPSGDTLVMGGLIEDNIQRQNQKVPLLGDIPVLGYLFRHDANTRTKQNLIVFITPTIVQDEDMRPTKAGTEYLKSPIPASDYLEPDWSAWESGQPKDRMDQNADSKSGGSGKFAPVP